MGCGCGRKLSAPSQLVTPSVPQQSGSSFQGQSKSSAQPNTRVVSVSTPTPPPARSTV